jgi:hypothetical protein
MHDIQCQLAIVDPFLRSCARVFDGEQIRPLTRADLRSKTVSASRENRSGEAKPLLSIQLSIDPDIIRHH